jgi:uncharacterized protein (TIGR02145 family)
MNEATERYPSRSVAWASVYLCHCGLLVLLLVGCLDFSPEPVPITNGSITDARDSQVYRTLTVEGVTWLQQDLNFLAPGSICTDTASVCTRRLYSWSTAMGVDSQFDTTLLGASSGSRQGVCPEGWHLPTVAEWLELQRIMQLPGITGSWLSSNGFDFKGWVHSLGESFGWYWAADEPGPEKATIARFQISYPMYGPKALVYIDQVTPLPKKSKLGVRCLLDKAK